MSLYDNRRSLGLLPEDELHDHGTCAFCGRRGTYPELIRVVILSTNAVGRRCADPVACVKRRRRAA